MGAWGSGQGCRQLETLACLGTEASGMVLLQLFFLSMYQPSPCDSTSPGGGRGRSHPPRLSMAGEEGGNWGVGGKGEDAGCPEQPPVPEVHFGDILMRIKYERALHSAWPRVPLSHGCYCHRSDRVRNEGGWRVRMNTM